MRAKVDRAIASVFLLYAQPFGAKTIASAFAEYRINTEALEDLAVVLPMQDRRHRPPTRQRRVCFALAACDGFVTIILQFPTKRRAEQVQYRSPCVYKVL